MAAAVSRAGGLLPALLLGAMAAGCASAPRAGPAGPAAEARRYRAAAEYSQARGGEALLVMRGDSIVFEAYQNGYDAATPHPLYSGTKSFACALALVAQEDGLLSLDEPAAPTLPELQDDPALAGIRVRHLLNLTSGLTLRPSTIPGRDRLVGTAPPGESWAYEGINFVLFVELLRQRLRERGEADALAYLQRRVFQPIGLQAGPWQRDAQGRPGLATGAALTAREWAKYGRLLRDAGRWEGRAVLPEARLRECFRGTTARPGYGLGFWLNAPPAPPLPPDLVMAVGAYGQRLYVLPSAGLVVVRFARGEQGAWSERDFLTRLLGLSAAPAARAPSGRR